MTTDPELQVDWIACQAFGLCHDLAPDLVTLDDWGYPLVPDPSEFGDRLADIQRIVDCCPARALRLARRDRGRGRTASERRSRGGAPRHQPTRLRA
jgi:ferredoxin